ncbi:hypothetical protein K469DRAFT_745570 [Zopfia rhizophila CBS 207.26]|uniref:Uncharacterized protein n=1 Tax=Zopfia rhizophila CBS 207.26 TaxID=1314779 RepID=A0A6A6EPM9_9PEZI|nr:hypothetical protein K469DRAFT_745570 [Zopfia rhizophila CBS 207.26]
MAHERNARTLTISHQPPSLIRLSTSTVLASSWHWAPPKRRTPKRTTLTSAPGLFVASGEPRCQRTAKFPSHPAILFFSRRKWFWHLVGPSLLANYATLMSSKHSLAVPLCLNNGAPGLARPPPRDSIFRTTGKRRHSALHAAWPLVYDSRMKPSLFPTCRGSVGLAGTARSLSSPSRVRTNASQPPGRERRASGFVVARLIPFLPCNEPKQWSA